MASKLNITQGPGVWDMIQALFGSNQQIVTLRLDNRQELLFHLMGVINLGVGHWLISGQFVRGSLPGYYMGKYSSGHRIGELWKANQEEQQLLFDLHDRDEPSQRAYARKLDRNVASAPVWVTREEAIRYAERTEGWSARTAKYVFSRLEKARLRESDRERFNWRQPVANAFRVEYELRSVLAFIGEGRPGFKLGAKSRAFIEDLLRNKLR